MLYDRPYMQQPHGPAVNNRSIVTTLLVTTIAIFVLQNLLNVLMPTYGSRNFFLSDWFALNGQQFKELKVWTVLSYAFLHSTSSLFHIIGNMLGLFFIGRILEPILGTRRFLILYLGGALIGGLIFLLFHYSDMNTVIGASGAVLALMTFFCLLRPEQPITLLLFFIIPITVKPKWVFWGSLGISVFGILFDELPAVRDPQAHQMVVAHSAHLGGILAGILFFRFAYNGTTDLFGRRSPRPAVEPPEWFKRKEKIAPKIT